MSDLDRQATGIPDAPHAGEKLARPSNFDLCQKCNASY